MKIIVPIGMEGYTKCDWLLCAAGMGIAGNGNCYLNGMWWSNHCPVFQDDEDISGYQPPEGE